MSKYKIPQLNTRTYIRKLRNAEITFK